MKTTRAEAVMQMCRVDMRQAVYMATAEHTGWPWVVTEMTDGIQRWGMAIALYDPPGIGDEKEAQEVV
jgi:hypothetical protein